jgi:hypothetical protein
LLNMWHRRKHDKNWVQSVRSVTHSVLDHQLVALVGDCTCLLTTLSNLCYWTDTLRWNMVRRVWLVMHLFRTSPSSWVTVTSCHYSTLLTSSACDNGGIDKNRMISRYCCKQFYKNLHCDFVTSLFTMGQLVQVSGTQEAIMLQKICVHKQKNHGFKPLCFISTRLLAIRLAECQTHWAYLSLQPVDTSVRTPTFTVLCMYGKFLDSGIPNTDIMLQFHKQDHFFIQGHFTSWAILSSRMPFEQVLYNLVLFSSCTPTTEISKNKKKKFPDSSF